MRVETITRKLYKYDELSNEAKEHAIEKLYDINVDDDYWYENIFEDVRTIATLMGINIKNIYFSGFFSQGDGACFEGSYEYRKGSVKAIKEYMPSDKELYSIAIGLCQIQKSTFYKLSADVKHSGHYSHSRCTKISVYNNDLATQNQIDTITELLRDFMNWIYSQLEKSYNYLTSEEVIIETIKANNYEFIEDGSL